MSTIPGGRKYCCMAGIHFWRLSGDAERCCSGWVPIRVPFEWRNDLSGWAEAAKDSSEDINQPWVRMLVAANEHDLIERLREREPNALREKSLNVGRGGIEPPALLLGTQRSSTYLM